MNIKEFAVHKFDVLVYIFLNAALMCVLIYFTRHGEGSELTIWAMRANDMALGALLASLGSGRGGNRGSDKNGTEEKKIGNGK